MCGMQMCQLIRILEDDKVHIWFGLGKERETRGLSHKLVIRYNTTSHQTKPNQRENVKQFSLGLSILGHFLNERLIQKTLDGGFYTQDIKRFYRDKVKNTILIYETDFCLFMNCLILKMFINTMFYFFTVLKSVRF